MAVITNKRSVMTLYSGAIDLLSHRVRIVLAEKGVTYDVVNVGARTNPNDLMDLNPYGMLPTLIDRELALYDPAIIIEYLDERFPHPPLMPVYPVARAKARLIMYRFDRDWQPLIRELDNPSSQAAEEEARGKLTDYFAQLVPVFASHPFFLGDDFSLVDCCLAPVLWRLPVWGVHFQSANEAKAISKYANRIFQRESFQTSLTEAEYELRKSLSEVVS